MRQLIVYCSSWNLTLYSSSTVSSFYFQLRNNKVAKTTFSAPCLSSRIWWPISASVQVSPSAFQITLEARFVTNFFLALLDGGKKTVDKLPLLCSASGATASIHLLTSNDENWPFISRWKLPFWVTQLRHYFILRESFWIDLDGCKQVDHNVIFVGTKYV